MTKPQVLITGVVLVNPELTLWLAADLWKLGDTWVVNGNGPGWDDGGTEVVMSELQDARSKWVRPLDHKSYFERRGVFVVRKIDLYVSPGAIAHMEKWS